MTKITTSGQLLQEVADKYTRIVLTEDKLNHEKFIERAGGVTELLLGVGDYGEVTPRTFRTLVRRIVRTAKRHQLTHIALQLTSTPFPKLVEMGDEWVARTLAENLALAAYEFTTYQSAEHRKAVVDLVEIRVCGEVRPAEKRSFSAGLTTATSMNHARDLINTPGVDLPPSEFIKRAKALFAKTDAVIKVLNPAAIKKHKMGLLEAVGKGAADGPFLLIIEYYGAGKPVKKNTTTAQAVLVGKGITFDSGGLNVKPAGAMHDMHMDMGGGGAVLGAMHAIASLKLKQNVVALIPLAENAISANSMRAGDIATATNGTTVEITHTDAEGRLVLADALSYAERVYQPRLMVDVATLTGAAMIALGQHTSAVMTKDSNLQQKLIELGERTGDLVWPLPLWDEYKEHIKGTRSDITNIATDFQRWGGAIEGGTFLSYFVKDTPWAHIDIAPRMSSLPSDHLAKGATGEPVRLLVELVQS